MSIDSESIYHITLMRHGESVGNASGYYQGQADFPLTESGEAQARALTERWLAEDVTFDLIISSTLTRARQTAEIIAGKLKVKVEFDPVWMERDNGDLAGKALDDIRSQQLQESFVHPYHHIGRTGESDFELYLRAGRAVQSLLDRPPGRYLAISHGGILNKVMYAILGIPVQANFQGAIFRFENASFATLEYLPTEHKWRILGLNDRSHWKGNR